MQKKCYKLVSPAIPVTWDNANSGCKSLGSELASIESQCEQNTVFEVANKAAAWIGGNDKDDPTNFSWINGDPWSYTNWNKNQPNHNSNQDCVKVKKNVGTWDDVSCNNAMLYCCQKAPW